MLALGQKASQGADQCARACSRGAAVSRKPPGGGGKGRAHKHAGGKKHHHQTVKHPPGHHKQPSHHGGGPAPPVVVKGHHHHHARGWSPGWDADCCAAEAAGVLLGLSDAGVLALYEATPRDRDGYATIEDTLEACRSERFELSWAGCDQPLHRGGCNPRENPLWPLRARDGSQSLTLSRACCEIGDGNNGRCYAEHQGEEHAYLYDGCPWFAH